MCGSATDAMEVSSTSMNVASITDKAISQGLTRGRQGSGAAATDSDVAVAALMRDHLTLTSGVTDMPGAKSSCGSKGPSNRILTGTRCTTFT